MEVMLFCVVANRVCFWFYRGSGGIVCVWGGGGGGDFVPLS